MSERDPRDLPESTTQKLREILDELHRNWIKDEKTGALRPRHMTLAPGEKPRHAIVGPRGVVRYLPEVDREHGVDT